MPSTAGQTSFREEAWFKELASVDRTAIDRPAAWRIAWQMATALAIAALAIPLVTLDATSSDAANKTRKKARSVKTSNSLPVQPTIPERRPENGRNSTNAPASSKREAANASERARGSSDAEKTGQSAATPLTPPVEAVAWSDREIIDALQSCIRDLGSIRVTISAADPMRKGACGAPAPVRLEAIELPQRITFKPMPTLNCAMVARLHDWFRDHVQPASIALVGSPVVRVHGGPGYTCRNRYGDPNAKLSEHALANALDIMSFETANGKMITVLDNWGPTRRDIAPSATSAAPPAATSAPVTSTASPPPPERKPKDLASARTRKPPPSRVTKAALHTPVTRPAALGNPATPAREDAAPAPTAKTARTQFLRQIHAAACGPFGTVLGPEANEAHRNHFHVDGAPRKRSAYCQ